MASNNLPYLEQPDLHVQAPHRAALLTYPGNLRAALQAARDDPKKTLFGTAQGIPSVFITKLMACTKPDFIWIDVEHGMFDRLTLHDAIHAAQHHSEGKALVIVRVPKGDPTALSTALDAGASGIVIPHTESAEEVRHMLKEVYYPPLGQRSFSPWTFTPGISDASLYEADSFNMKNSNNHICVIPQIESVKGLANIEEIASMPEISGLMFGPGDYMADAGIPLQLGGVPAPEFIAAMTKFVETAKKYNLPLFGGAQSPAMIPMMLQQGYAAIAVVFDIWGFTTLVSDTMKAAKAIVENMGKEETPAETNGVKTTNGAETNGTAKQAVTVNGKEVSS